MNNFAVIFDMDGVIVDSNPTHKISLDIFTKKYGFLLSDEEMKTRLWGRTNKDWISDLFKAKNLTPQEVKLLGVEKEKIFREIYEKTIQPVKGLENFLKLLNKNQIKIAIATSAPSENVNFVLEKTGLRDYFPVILDETFIQKGKPDPEIYLKTAKALGLPNSKCIVIEDSLSGVQAGKDSGSKVIGITTTHSKEELFQTDFVISDFEGLNFDKLAEIVR